MISPCGFFDLFLFYVGEWDLADWLERLTTNAKVATFTDTVEYEGAADEAVLNKVLKK